MSPVASAAPRLRARAGPICDGSWMTRTPAASATTNASRSGPDDHHDFVGGRLAGRQRREAVAEGGSAVVDRDDDRDSHSVALAEAVRPGIVQSRGLTRLALVFAMSIFRYFDSDELEHVHSAWYVLNGAVPYVDFFEHHHAPLWYLLAPALAVLPEAAWALVALRLAFFLLVPATAWATYRLARECGAARETAWLSVFLLLSMTTFTYVAIEVRPDVPQTLLGVTSAIFFVRLLRTQRARDAVLCGLAAAAAFLFLQKVVLLFPLYAAAFTVAAVSRRVRWRLGWYAAAAFAAACAPFAAWLAVAGAFDDYVVTNWLINARVGAGRSPWSFLVAATLRDFGRNAVFWALSIAMGVEAFRRRPQAPYALPAWFGWGLVALIFATNRVVDRYLVAAIPFLAAAAGMWLAEEAARRRVAGPRVTALLLVVCLLPTIGMTRSVFRRRPGTACTTSGAISTCSGRTCTTSGS